GSSTDVEEASVLGGAPRTASRVSDLGGAGAGGDGECYSLDGGAAAAAGAEPPEAPQQASSRNLSEPRLRYHRLCAHLQTASIRSPSPQEPYNPGEVTMPLPHVISLCVHMYMRDTSP
uniref:Uncharacterized protein n=1 Tax=Oryza brachyantha TaxID=4533 RepID=J3M3F2_ORYBR